jgi:hypothetical protein
MTFAIEISEGFCRQSELIGALPIMSLVNDRDAVLLAFDG